MEEALQKEKQDLEYQNPNDDQGGIRRRLRDRDLLRKRKAEAEEKETNQVESQRKRPRADEKSGTKKRGRPRKVEPTPEIQEEAAEAQEAPAVVVVPEPTELITTQTSGSFSQPPHALAALAAVPVLGSAQLPIFAPSAPPAPVNPTPAVISPSALAPSPVKNSDAAPVVVPDAVPVPALTKDPVPDAVTAPLLVENLYTESQAREALDKVLVEDLGPDEKEDISPSQDKEAEKGLSESPLSSIPEKTQMFSVPTLSSLPPSQEYVPGK